MAVKSSGANVNLRLRGTASDGETDINEEINGEGTGSDISLNTLSTGAGFDTTDGGHKMSEFFDYSAGASDARTSGSPSAPTAKWIASSGVNGKIHLSTNNNPAANSWTSYQLMGSSDYVQDACWDGFTWVVVGNAGVYQTSNSAGTSGWVRVSTLQCNTITPVMGGWIAGRGNSTAMVYSTNITGTVSASNWTSVGISGYPSGTQYIFTILPIKDKLVVGTRKDYSGDSCWHYLDIPDLAQGMDTSVTSWNTGPSPPWGRSQAYDPDNDNWMFAQRSGGAYRGAVGSSSKTQDKPSFASSYNENLKFLNGKFWVYYPGVSSIAYKNSYTGSWNNITGLSDAIQGLEWNGSYYGIGINYAGTYSNAVGGSTNGTSWSYIAANTMGADATNTYIRMFRSGVRPHYGSWKNLGNSSQATYVF